LPDRWSVHPVITVNRPFPAVPQRSGGMRREWQVTNAGTKFGDCNDRSTAGLVGHRAPQINGRRQMAQRPVPPGTVGVRPKSPLIEERKRARRRWHPRLDVEGCQIPPSLPASPRWAPRGESVRQPLILGVFLAQWSSLMPRREGRVEPPEESGW